MTKDNDNFPNSDSDFIAKLEEQIGGLLNPEGELLGRSLLPGNNRVWIPQYVRLDDDRLFWSSFDLQTQRVVHQSANSEGMLDAFIRIRNGQDVVHFAKRYGVLEICQHGFPASHPGSWPTQKECYPLYCDDNDHRLIWEPIDRWLDYSGKARALLKIAADLRDGQRPRPDDWLAAYEPYYLRFGAHTFDTRGQRYFLVSLVNKMWLDFGEIRLSLQWDDQERPTIEFSLSSTFMQLAVQLMAAITGTDGLAVCSGCGTIYPRKERKPKAGQNNWCLRCKKGDKDSRERQRKHRAKVARMSNTNG